MLVHLGDLPVGTLRLEEGEYWVFQTLPGYRSPLYDQVYTRAFIENDSLALNLGDEKDFFRIDLETFRRFARKVRTDPENVVRVAEEAAAEIREAWRSTRPDLPLSSTIQRQVDRHLDAVRL